MAFSQLKTPALPESFRNPNLVANINVGNELRTTDADRLTTMNASYNSSFNAQIFGSI